MPQNIFKRYVLHPLKYSFSGLKYALDDRAFCFEIVLGVLFFPPLILHFRFSLKLLLLLIGYFIILIVEAVNCAIEAAVDLAAPTIHPLAKRAKDMASGAVLLALCNLALIFIYCFFK